jgi:hypothetical protein
MEGWGGSGWGLVELVHVSVCPSSVGMVWSVSLHAPPLSPHGIRECVRNRSGGGREGVRICHLFVRWTSQSSITKQVTKTEFL